MQRSWRRPPPNGVDVSTPNVARMYDYYLGGKDNFEADRVAAERVLAQIPGLRRAAVENRRFLRRVVRFLADEAGIDQSSTSASGCPPRVRCTRSHWRSTPRLASCTWITIRSWSATGRPCSRPPIGASWCTETCA